jgi:hypothetical protein
MMSQIQIAFFNFIFAFTVGSMLGSPLVAHADGKDELKLSTAQDWDQLFATCESNWQKYDNDLNRLRTVLKREIDAMTEAEYNKRYQNDDPMIRFVRAHWPAVFSAKDPGWNMYQACAELNLDARKALSDVALTRVERKKVITKFNDCVLGVWAPRGPLPKPFDRLLACYNKQNK